MKVLSTQTNLGSATNVSNASVVRLFNSGNDNILVTQKDFGGIIEGSFIVPSGDVVYVEKNYTDTLEGSGDVLATKTAYSSMMKFVSAAGSSSPTYTYSVSPTNVDEGGNFTTTITTTNVDDNTTLYWSLSGTNVTSADFSSGALTGSVTISNNSASFSHTVANDTLTEGTEQVAVKLFTDSNRTEQVGNTVTVNLSDTSQSPIAGQQAFTSAGAFSWTAPSGVTSVSVVCIGGGGGGQSSGGSSYGGGGGGAALRYLNNYTVTPGSNYTVVVGAGGASDSDGGDSYFINPSTVRGGGGHSPNNIGDVGAFGSTTGGNGGGLGGRGAEGNDEGANPGGGGGAGGYSGQGGDGGGYSRTFTDGAGGAGGGGKGGGGGGGTGILGQGANGQAGQGGEAGGGYAGGEGGSGGNDGQAGNQNVGGVGGTGGTGGSPGGGGGGGQNGGKPGGAGANGAVRIIWPGNLRSFPSTRTADE